MNTEFVDYYELLGIDPHVDQDAIIEAIANARHSVDKERLYPHKHQWVEQMDFWIERAEATLLDPVSRGRYDEERERHYDSLREQQATSDELLMIDPPAPYVFYADDPDPAYTVPGLAHKFDADLHDTGGKQAIEDIRQHTVESMLRYVGFGQANQQRYEALAEKIAQLRERLAESHPLQMLESVIALCDATIPPPQARLQELDSGESALPSVSLRPDRDGHIILRVSHGGPRGCLFGYIWVEDAWARISSPPPGSITSTGRELPAVWFELLPAAHAEITLAFDASQLMQLTRPAQHRLRLGLVAQLGTSHENRSFFSLPVDITPIPPKAVFEPAVLVLPIVRRGQPATASAALANKGELPLEASLVTTSDNNISVRPSFLPDAATLSITVDTSGLPYGGHYEKTVVYHANGDNPEVTLRIEGETLPTALQHIVRQQPLRDRVTLALLAALAPVVLSPFTLYSTNNAVGWIFWAFWGVLIAAGTAGVVAWTTLRLIGHAQAAGDQGVSQATVPWQLLLTAAAGCGIFATLLLALLPLPADAKIAVIFWILAFLAATWGFFAKEDLRIYALKGRPSQGASLTGRLSTDTRQTLKVLLVFADAITAGIVVIQLTTGNSASLLCIVLTGLLSIAVVAL